MPVMPVRVLDATQQEKIRRLYAAGGITQTTLARRFGVSLDVISRTLRARVDAASRSVPALAALAAVLALTLPGCAGI